MALGHGNKEQQIAQLNSVVQMANGVMQGGSQMVSPQNMYNASAQLLKAMGYQNVDEFLTPPEMQQPPGPTPEQQKMQADMQKAQAEVQKDQAEVMIKQGKLQLDQQEFEHKRKMEEMDVKLKVAELETEITEGRHVKLG